MCGRLNDIYHYIMELDISNNVDIGFDCDCNSQSDSLISCIVQNLVHTGNRYEMGVRQGRRAQICIMRTLTAS